MRPGHLCNLTRMYTNLHFLLFRTGIGTVLGLKWGHTHLHHLGDQVKLLLSLTLNLIHLNFMIGFKKMTLLIYFVEKAVLKEPGHLLPLYPVLVRVHHVPLSPLLFLPQMTQYCNTSVALPSPALPCPAVQLYSSVHLYSTS